MQIHSLLPDVISIAKQAGAVIMRIYDEPIDIVSKADNSPLTQADLSAHEIIETALKALTPTLPVLSEESDALSYDVRANWRCYWLIDPLDGTREFIKRNGEFTVNIALIQKHSVVLGVVYAPALELLYFADAEGAFRQEGGQKIHRIRARPLNLTDITVVSSRSHARNGRLQGFVKNMGQQSALITLVQMGSSLKICMVAEGAADLYPRLGPTSEWDTAAAQCILEKAGGRIVNIQGSSLLYNSRDSLLNPEFMACGATVHNWWQYLQ